MAADYVADVEHSPYLALYEQPVLRALLPPVAGRRVLDAGCGAGLVLAELLDGAEPHRPGVVDDDIEPTEVRDGLFDGGEHRGAVGHIRGDAQRVVTQQRRRARDRHDTVSRGECRLREGTAEPSAGARDQPYAWCSGHAGPPYRDETSRIE